MANHKLDTDQQVFFYEQDFYVLSNFSAFAVHWKGLRFDTSEAVYHYEKFNKSPRVSIEKEPWHAVTWRILHADSAHEAFKIAEENAQYRRPDWDEVKVGIMKQILQAKLNQHEYVRRKLLATGDRELIEDSWRDSFWGWGEDKQGQNALGKLWMELRKELREEMSQPDYHAPHHHEFKLADPNGSNLDTCKVCGRTRGEITK